MAVEDTRGRLLHGAGEIAEFLFGDPEERKKVYGMVDLIPVFSTGPNGRVICGFSNEIVEALSARGREPVEQRLPMRKNGPRPRRVDNRRRNKTEVAA